MNLVKWNPMSLVIEPLQIEWTVLEAFARLERVAMTGRQYPWLAEREQLTLPSSDLV